MATRRATQVYYEGCFGNTYSFRVKGNEEYSFYVNGIEDGIVSIETYCGNGYCFDYRYAELISACFFRKSNFARTVFRVLAKPNTFKGIKINVNGVSVTVTATSSDPYKIYESLENQMAREELRRKAKYASSEEVEILRTDIETDMLFQSEAARAEWQKIVIANQDGFGYNTVVFARRWAKYMQKLIASGSTVSEVADSTYRAADSFGLTGTCYGWVISILADCWKYGVELRNWREHSAT